ncbi:sortase domain-containing protein [Fodinicola acaciae]|uniref:sortase domain-containing protein n=1 Tax=Fodinicola acaciae TaxID=2681555 RepID=UPI0013D51D4F|nr:class F sortase [Fodinicola acaciae]
MSGLESRRRFVTVVATLVVVAVVAGVGYGLVSLFFGAPGSRPPATAQAPSGAPTPSASTPALSHSIPTHLSIPAIGVDGALQQVGVDPARNTLQQPAKPAQAAWFKNSRTPGQTGAAILVGYISTGTKTHGVFAKLGALKPGGEIRIARADGTTVVFAVDSITEYAANELPTDKVFANTAEPTLRIITCGGSLHGGGKTSTNVVVYAHMTATA